MPDQALGRIAEAADGDARRALNFLEGVSDLAEAGEAVDDKIISQVLQKSLRRFDKGGDIF